MNNRPLALFVLLTALFATGCRVVSYESPTGGSLFLGNVGLTTNIDGLEVEKGDTKVKVQGYKSEAGQALDLANKLVDKVP